MLLEAWHKVLDKLQLYGQSSGIDTGIMCYVANTIPNEILEDDLVPLLNCVDGVDSSHVSFVIAEESPVGASFTLFTRKIYHNSSKKIKVTN